MMLEPAMNKLLEQIPSRYMLVNVVAKRAREIANEAEDRARAEAEEGKPIKSVLTEKPVTLAIHEVADGKVTPHVD